MENRTSVFFCISAIYFGNRSNLTRQIHGNDIVLIAGRAPHEDLAVHKFAFLHRRAFALQVFLGADFEFFGG